MSWESALLQKTRLGAYRHCLALLDAYTESAPAWERCCLTAYVTIGPVLARCLGADTLKMWQSADGVVADMLAASNLSPSGITEMLRRYVRVKLDGEDHLPFGQACAEIYSQPFYPVVTHFTFALQPSACARMRFVREIVECMTDGPAAVADLGCGPGVILSELLLMKPLWTGYGLDISLACVDYAKRLATHKHVADRTEVTLGDIAELPFEDESLDLVIASEVIEHVPESELVLMEIARTLRPGGQLVITIPLESHTPAHLQTFHGPEELFSHCETADLRLKSAHAQWHFSFGDDRRHLFAQFESPAPRVLEATRPASAVTAAAVSP
jgi:SAM-dependent methyltransferase